MTENKGTTEAAPVNGQRKQLVAAYSTKDLKKIYFRSESIKAIAAIIVVAIVGLTVKSGIIGNYGGKNIIISTLSTPLNIAIIVVNIVAFIGLVTRAAWGRMVGILNCAIWLIRFPLWTFLGLWGLFVLIPSGMLFGVNRIQATDLKAELKWRKEKIA